MTRLTGDDLRELEGDLPELDARLRRATGVDLRAIALRAADADAVRSFAGHRVGVVPVTSGQGVIPGFSEAVAGVASHLGCDAFVAPVSDVAGLAFVVERGPEVVLAADDRRFIALHLSSRGVVDNGEATGEAYATALAAAAGGVAGRPVLVLGLGAVGAAAAARLDRLGARVIAYDPDASRAGVAARSLPVVVVDSPAGGLASCDLVVDASPSARIIPGDWVTTRSVVAAPGMPLGATPAAVRALGDRLIHEPLALGVATMIARALFGRRPVAGPPGHYPPQPIERRSDRHLRNVTTERR